MVCVPATSEIRRRTAVFKTAKLIVDTLDGQEQVAVPRILLGAARNIAFLPELAHVCGVAAK
jgi:hypothetical protein